VVGRAHGNAVRIPSSEVSRQHCRLMLEDGLVYLEDLNSINGTFLNGRMVRDLEVVRPGDRLGVGPVVFVVEYELSPEALDRLRKQAAPEGEPMFLEMVEAAEAESAPLELEVLDEPGAAVRLDNDLLEADFELTEFDQEE
jgi:pSer/pThr/pTyr-binding forkhead associated (FHA) protein